MRTAGGSAAAGTVRWDSNKTPKRPNSTPSTLKTLPIIAMMPETVTAADLTELFMMRLYIILPGRAKDDKEVTTRTTFALTFAFFSPKLLPRTVRSPTPPARRKSEVP